jgi:hypothetical protein
MIKKYKAVAIPVGFFALTLLFAASFQSCARRQRENIARQPTEGGSASGSTVEAGALGGAPAASPAPSAIEPQPPAPAGTAPTALNASPPPAATLAASLRAYGLGADRPILPEDFDIGALQNLRGSQGAIKDILSVAQRFIEGLSTGTLDTGLLDPAVRPVLALLLAPSVNHFSGKLSSYRIGAIEIKGDSASLEVGIPESDEKSGSKSEMARGRGRLSLGLSEDRWYVEAFVLDRGPEPSTFTNGIFDPDTLQYGVQRHGAARRSP